ncbi:MAG: signal recognition particle-docking protein FtsY [Spirochaetales bacterium]|nr:signal recognition particle-docking protein FtsY [Spirochaetales bacterium]
MAGTSFAQKLKRFFGLHGSMDDVFFEDLADALIEGDFGARAAFEIVETLEKRCKTEGLTEKSEILGKLGELLAPDVRECSLVPEIGKTNVYLLLGVNGVGKTTSAAKMAHAYNAQGYAPVVLAAADTFRAAAIEQLQLHGERLSLRVVAQAHGADPGAVIYDAAEAVRSQGGGLVIADTAGRLHNKDNLVRELQKIDRIAASRSDHGCYKKLLVLDATTGQNGLRQAEVFHEAVGVDALILTKYDSTARGGVALAAGRELGLPVAFVGTGEGYGDFSRFSASKYLDEFIGLTE